MNTNKTNSKRRTFLFSNPCFINLNKNEKSINSQTENVEVSTIKIDLQNGMKIFINETIVHKPVLTHDFNDLSRAIGIGFCMTGQMNANLKKIGKKYITSHGESSLFYFSNVNGSYKYFQDKPLNRLHIEFDPDCFLKFLNDERHHLPHDLLDSVEKDNHIFYRSKDSITPDMMFIINQILNCPYHGDIRNFFFQGKALELIANKLRQLQKYKRRPADSLNPSSLDVERIMHVKKLMSQNLEVPPSIEILSKKTGASRSKLYRDFCKIHGDSPTNFLRDLRIKKAEQLLREGKMNITEVAYSVGYSNISYFAKVFREYFSVPPSIYLKNLHSGKKN